MSLQQLKQLFNTLIYPYISYGILGWGSTCQTNIHKLLVKQNTVIRVIFRALTYGKGTENAITTSKLTRDTDRKKCFPASCPQINLLASAWQRNQQPKLFHSYVQYASAKHSYNTR